MRIYYKILKDGKIVSWVKTKSGYYIFIGRYLFLKTFKPRCSNKRLTIKREILKSPYIDKFYNCPPCNSPYYSINIKSELLKRKQSGFNGLEMKLWRELNGED